MNFGKFLFDLNKKKHAAKKKQKQVQVKEIKFRPATDESDYQIKLRSLRKFLDNGDKVKVTLRWKGREFYGNRDLGKNLFLRIKDEIKEISTIEQEPKMLGRQLVMILNPSN